MSKKKALKPVNTGALSEARVKELRKAVCREAGHMYRHDDTAIVALCDAWLSTNALRREPREVVEVPVDDLTHAIDALDATASEFDLFYQHERVGRLRKWLALASSQAGKSESAPLCLQCEQHHSSLECPPRSTSSE